MTTREAQIEAIEALKAHAQQSVERVWNEGQFDTLDVNYAPDFIRHNPPNSDLVGIEAFKQYIIALRTAFPDFTLCLDEMIVEGTTQAGRWHCQGTNTGPLPEGDLPPTGKPVEMKGLFFLHTRDGKIVEEWSYGDMMGMFQQLGLLPPM